MVEAVGCYLYAIVKVFFRISSGGGTVDSISETIESMYLRENRVIFLG